MTPLPPVRTPADDARSEASREGEPIRWRDGLQAAALSVLLAAAVTAPASLRPAKRLIGSAGSDVWEHLWGQWWRARELAGGDLLPRSTRLLGFPEGGALWDPDLLSGSLSVALQPWLGMPASYNVTVIAVLALNGFTGWLLARGEGCRQGSSLAAGAVVLGAPLGLGLVHNGVAEQTHLWATCLFLWAWLRFVRTGTAGSRAALWAAATALGVANVYSVQFAAVAAALLLLPAWREARDDERSPARCIAEGASVPLALTGAWYLLYSRHLADPDRLDWRDFQGAARGGLDLFTVSVADTFLPPGGAWGALPLAAWAAAVALAVTGLGLALRAAGRASPKGLILAGLLVALAIGVAPGLPVSAEAGPEGARSSARPHGSDEPVAVPRPVRDRFAPWLVEALQTPRSLGEGWNMVHPAYLGVVLPLAALAGAAGKRRARKWLPVLAVGLFWSLGPRIELPALGGGGPPVGIPGPYAFVADLPPFRFMQFPYRAQVLALLAAAVGLAFALDWLAGRRSRTAAGLVLVGAALELAVFSPLPWPLPAAPLPETDGLRFLAADASPGAVLEVPRYLHGEVGNGYALYGQTVHGRGLPHTLNARPDQSAQPLNGFLHLLDAGTAHGAAGLKDVDADDVVGGIDLLVEQGFRYIVVRDDTPMSDARVRAAAAVRLLEGAVGWKAVAARPLVYRIDPVTALAREGDLYGWGGRPVPGVPKGPAAAGIPGPRGAMSAAPSGPHPATPPGAVPAGHVVPPRGGPPGGAAPPGPGPAGPGGAPPGPGRVGPTAGGGLPSGGP